MAENKKSFILYVDQKSTIDMLSDEQAGRLLKHIYAYVNDENPILESLELKLVFEPIKLQFKRDLKKWENTKEQKSVAGIMGNLKRYNADLYEAVQSNSMQLSEAQNIAEHRKSSQRDTELAVNVNDNVNVNVTVTDNVKKNNIEERKLKFASTLEPFVLKYGRDSIKAFYLYWTEPNKSNTKFRMELEKTWSLERRLDTWISNESKFEKEKSSAKKEKTSVESIRQELGL